MKYKRSFSLLCAAALSVLCAGCAGSETSEPVQTTEASVTTSAPVTTGTPETGTQLSSETVLVTSAAPIELEPAIAAADDEAFLYINDGRFYIGYTGEAESSYQMPRMCYDAGVAKITGDGQYTVSVRNDTKALRLDATKDPEGDLRVSGCQFAAVVINKGSLLYPHMCIEINEIRKDGKPVEMIAKNYTSSDNQIEMRANIYNQWVNAFPKDAHTADGPVTGEFGEYSAQIIDPDKLGEWTKIEVDFTVKGCSGPLPASTTTSVPQDAELTTASAVSSDTTVSTETALSSESTVSSSVAAASSSAPKAAS